MALVVCSQGWLRRGHGEEGQGSGDEGLLEGGELGGGEADLLGEEGRDLLLEGFAVLAVGAAHGLEELAELALGELLDGGGLHVRVGDAGGPLGDDLVVFPVAVAGELPVLDDVGLGDSEETEDEGGHGAGSIGSGVAVDEHTAALLDFVEDGGEGVLVATGIGEDGGVAVHVDLHATPSEGGVGCLVAQINLEGDADIVAKGDGRGALLREAFREAGGADDLAVGDMAAFALPAAEVAAVGDSCGGIVEVDLAKGAGGLDELAVEAVLAAGDEVVEEGAAYLGGQGMLDQVGGVVARVELLAVLADDGLALACGEAWGIVGGVGEEPGDGLVGDVADDSQGWLRRGLGLVGGRGGLAGLEAEGVGCLDEGGGLGLEIFLGHGWGLLGVISAAKDGCDGDALGQPCTAAGGDMGEGEACACGEGAKGAKVRKGPKRADGAKGARGAIWASGGRPAPGACATSGAGWLTCRRGRVKKSGIR